MKELILTLVLCSYLDKHDDSTLPKEDILHSVKSLDYTYKCVILEYAINRNLHFPQLEEIDWASFEGCYTVFWCRAQGRPLAYPIDPILGMRVP